jgi:hypothetical protein
VVLHPVFRPDHQPQAFRDLRQGYRSFPARYHRSAQPSHRPIYNLAKQFTKLMPVFFNEIGAEGRAARCFHRTRRDSPAQGQADPFSPQTGPCGIQQPDRRFHRGHFHSSGSPGQTISAICRKRSASGAPRGSLSTSSTAWPAGSKRSCASPRMTQFWDGR